MIQTILNTKNIPVVFLIRYLNDFFFNKRRKAKSKGRRAEWSEEERRKEKILKKIHIPWYHTIEYLNYESIIPNDCLLTSTFSLGILIACMSSLTK